MRSDRAISLLLLAMAAVLPAEAGVIFSDLGPGNTYAAGGWNVGLSTDQVVAAPFTPGANYTLSQIDLALIYDSGTNSVTVNLMSDTAGLPGALIESWVVTSLPIFNASLDTLQTVTPVGSVSLNSGHQYWVEVLPADITTSSEWMENSVGLQGGLYVSNEGFGNISSQTLPAFDVLGSSAGVGAVPEPHLAAPMAVVLLGWLSSWAGAIRRRRPTR